MKHVKLDIFLSAFFSLLLGAIGGYYIGYFPMKKEVEYREQCFEYYRDKYLDECEKYEKIMQIASSQQLDDDTKLIFIRATYTPKRLDEINKAIKLKKSLERNK